MCHNEGGGGRGDHLKMTHIFTVHVKLIASLLMDLFSFKIIKKKFTNSLVCIIIISDNVFPEKCIDTKLEYI